MAREARVVAEGVPYPITQRGNNRQDVFLLDEDRRFYIEVLRAKAREHGLTILGWCLMTNHVHLIAVPQRPESLAKAVGQAHWRHTMRFNRRYGRSGHLWQGRFYSCPLGPTHLVAALAYVDLNPVRAGLVGRAAQYRWSSAAPHAIEAPGDPLIDDWAWSELGLARDWPERLDVEAAGVRDAALRRATFTGLPFGDVGFVEEMEARLGRGETGRGLLYLAFGRRSGNLLPWRPRSRRWRWSRPASAGGPADAFAGLETWRDSAGVGLAGVAAMRDTGRWIRSF